MNDTNIITAIIAGVTGVLTAIGAPKMWDYFAKKKQIEVNEKAAIREEEEEKEEERLQERERYQRKIQKLELHLLEVITQVDTLLTIIRNEFDSSPAIKETIDKVDHNLDRIRKEHELNN